MSLNSVNTNTGAMIALQSLNQTNQQLATVQKRVSTGYRVADATDDGAAYAVAQSVRSTVSSLTTANQQLGNVQGLLSTTQSNLNKISDTMASMRDVLVDLSNTSINPDTRKQYSDKYASLLDQVKGFIQDSAYSGKTLIGNIAGHSGTFSSVSVVRNEVGATYGIGTFGGSALFGSINFTAGQLTNAANVAALITENGTFLKQQSAVGTALNKIGAAANYVTNQINFNSDKVDALNSGLGALVDADLAKESAQLQALQIRQQLGTQALSLANQAPQTLLSLFK